MPDGDMCPECEQGKHDNCTELVLTDLNGWVDCVCPTCSNW